MGKSMQRDSTSRTHSIPPVPGQPMKHRNDVFIARLWKRVVGQLYGQGQKLVVVHPGIVGDRCCRGHSYFPKGSYAAILRGLTCNCMQFVFHKVEQP